MTLLEAIHSRHSVRKFIDKPIEEDIVRILQVMNCSMIVL